MSVAAGPDPCPCGSGADYQTCCAVFHRGADAPTALQLMRSRYAAFVKRDAGYLARTSHPLLRAKLDAKNLRASFALAWSRLDIMSIRDGGADDRQGMVHFRATWKDAAGAEQSHEERSRFVRDGGAWVYRDAGG